MFAGFNGAVRSMQNAQFAITVHSSNIAHANDPAYTRRDVLALSQAGLNGPGIARLRDAFVDDQYRVANGLLGEAEVRQDVMSKIEDIFGDPIEGGLRKAIDNLADAFQGLAENPSDGVARLGVISAAKGFAQEIRSAYRQLSAVEQTTNEQLQTRVDEVNGKLQQVFELNKRISDMSRHNMDDAELRDQRDGVLDDLAKLTGAQAFPAEDGTVRVIIGSTPAVDGPTLLQLQLIGPAGQGGVAWNSFGTPAYDGGGTITGILGVRGGDLAQIKAEIDSLGKTVAQAINDIQLDANAASISGTRPPIFNIGPGPADISVNSALGAGDIAASSSAAGLPSNGDNARRMAALFDATTREVITPGDTSPLLSSVIMQGQAQSPRTFYRNLVGWLGNRAKDANDDQGIAQAHVKVGEQQRQSQSGVSVDEETANLMVQQKAFQAAARVITVMDEMLDSLINRTAV
jgi:flagellar hook-associated protein 1 FlgK